MTHTILKRQPILSPNDYRPILEYVLHTLATGTTELLPVIEIEGKEYQINYFDMDHFNFQTLEQYESWKSKLAAKQKEFKLFQHQFMTVNGAIDYQKMIRTADEMIRSGLDDPFKVPVEKEGNKRSKKPIKTTDKKPPKSKSKADR